MTTSLEYPLFSDSWVAYIFQLKQKSTFLEIAPLLWYDDKETLKENYSAEVDNW